LGRYQEVISNSRQYQLLSFKAFLLSLFLIERKVLATPLLYLSAFFEATRNEYYSRLLAVIQNSEWNLWLEYFLNGIARMSEDALSRAERINLLIQNWREMIAGPVTGL